MKRHTLITICLLSFLMGLGCKREVPRPESSVPRPPPPPLMVRSFTSAERERVEGMAAAAVVPPAERASQPLLLPPGINPKDYVWELWRKDTLNTPMWFVKELDGDTTYHASTPGYYLLVGVPLKVWLKGLPPL